MNILGESLEERVLCWNNHCVVADLHSFCCERFQTCGGRCSGLLPSMCARRRLRTAATEEESLWRASICAALPGARQPGSTLPARTLSRCCRSTHCRPELQAPERLHTPALVKWLAHLAALLGKVIR